MHRLLSSLQRQSIFRQDLCIIISLEMPVPSQDHYGFPSFPVVDWFCLFVDICVLHFPLEDCSVFCNFVITLNWFSKRSSIHNIIEMVSWIKFYGAKNPASIMAKRFIAWHYLFYYYTPLITHLRKKEKIFGNIISINLMALWTETSPLSEVMRSCMCCPNGSKISTLTYTEYFNSFWLCDLESL
jgi:hypothetical protein